jgi:hypothetical protein
MRCLATCSTKSKPLFLNTSASVTGLSGLQWTDKYLHLGKADTNTITDFLKTFSTYSGKKVTVFWKSKKQWNPSEIFTNSEDRTPLERSSYHRTNTLLNRSKTDHQHRQISVKSWISFRHLHRYLTTTLHHLRCLLPDTLHPVPARPNLQQQLRQQWRRHGPIRPIITPAAVAVTTLHTSINTILIGWSMIFITISMDITSTL